MKLEFSQEIFEKNPQISNFMKNCSVGAKLLHAYRQKDRPDEAISHLSQFCKCTLTKVHDIGTVKPKRVLFQRVKRQDKNLHGIDNNV